MNKEKMIQVGFRVNLSEWNACLQYGSVSQNIDSMISQNEKLQSTIYINMSDVDMTSAFVLRTVRISESSLKVLSDFSKVYDLSQSQVMRRLVHILAKEVH